MSDRCRAAWNQTSRLIGCVDQFRNFKVGF